MSLNAVTIGTADRPPRLVIYGVHGVGKTTFGASGPSPIVLRTEDGIPALRVPTFPKAETYGDAMEALRVLYQEEHPYQTLVVDTLDWLEPLIWAHTAFQHGKESIEDFGYGKGYTFAVEAWQQFLGALDALNRDRGMTIVCIAHAEIKRFDAPETDPYDRYQVKLHKRAADLVQEWADVVGFAHYEVNITKSDVGFNKKVARGVGAGTRLLAVEERPAFSAKNRYQLPPVLPLSWAAFAEACAPAFAPVPAVDIAPEPVEADEPDAEPAALSA